MVNVGLAVAATLTSLCLAVASAAGWMIGRFAVAEGRSPLAIMPLPLRVWVAALDGPRVGRVAVRAIEPTRAPPTFAFRSAVQCRRHGDDRFAD